MCSKRPAAYGRGSFLLLDKIDEVCYTINVVKHLDVRVKSAYAFFRVNYVMAQVRVKLSLTDKTDWQMTKPQVFWWLFFNFQSG